MSHGIVQEAIIPNITKKQPTLHTHITCVLHPLKNIPIITHKQHMCMHIPSTCGAEGDPATTVMCSNCMCIHQFVCDNWNVVAVSPALCPGLEGAFPKKNTCYICLCMCMDVVCFFVILGMASNTVPCEIVVSRVPFFLARTCIVRQVLLVVWLEWIA